MSDKIRAVLDAATTRALAYRPKEKGEWVERVKRQRRKRDQKDDRESSI